MKQQFRTLSYIHKHIALISLLFVSMATFSQNELSEKKENKRDSVKISFRPIAIRLGVDLIGATKTVIDSDKTELEYSADIQLSRYLLNFAYGQFEVLRSGSNASTYQNEGTYFRTGIDINLFKKDPEINVLFIGWRYGKAKFDDRLEYLQRNVVFGDKNFDETNINTNARWWELVAGIKLHMIKNFWLGFTTRFKFSLKVDQSDIFVPYEVPGYGKASTENYWGFNYQLMYRIPFSKK